MTLLESAESKFALVNGFRTHYLEGGKGDPVILLHSGEFGACGALSWEWNFDELAKHFHVFAPDWLGFGQSEKVFFFDDMWNARVNHISAFISTLRIGRAHFIGNSMGGTVLVNVAALNTGRWPIDRMVLVSGGGNVPDNDDRKVLTEYDGSEDAMKRMVDVLIKRPALRDDPEYVRRRHALSIQKGAWECVAAARFKAPVRERKPIVDRVPAYSKINVPTLIVAGRQDSLRELGYADSLQREIPGSQLIMMDGGHCPQIDDPEYFNDAVLKFLRS
ncbi:alpha/beta fold hydrolase (plasmid) [Paraburkholderia strydomiana]